LDEWISVRVPATGANLGCLFDCGAIAFGLYLNIRARARADDQLVVRYQGLNPERVSSGSDNLIAVIIQETLREWGKPRGFELEIENQIPVGAGAGSSAAAIVGALAVSCRLAGRTPNDEEIVLLANRREGHPDNVAAAWLGGFTVALETPTGVLCHSCPLPDSLGLILAVPDYALSTVQSRKCLPDAYSRVDTVHNLQRAVALTAQIFSGRVDLRRCLFDDRWHQPFRSHLVPGLEEVLALQHPDLLGVCLSGAGPSLLAFTRGDSEAVGNLIQATLEEKLVRTRIYCVASDPYGAKGWLGSGGE